MDQYICINDTFTGEQRNKIPFLPKKDLIYTLQEIVDSGHPSRPEGFIFEELPNPPLKDGYRVNFRPSRFRPLDKININNLIKETNEIFS